jgi:hypothetical protein
LKRAEELRNQISSQYPKYATSFSPELSSQKIASAEVMLFQVIADRVLLFPYESPLDPSVKKGLLEAFKGESISEVKPVLLKKGQKITWLQNSTLNYPDQELSISRVKVTSDTIIDLKTNKLLPTITLLGWVLSSKIEPVMNAK